MLAFYSFQSDRFLSPRLWRDARLGQHTRPGQLSSIWLGVNLFNSSFDLCSTYCTYIIDQAGCHLAKDKKNGTYQTFEEHISELMSQKITRRHTGKVSNTWLRKLYKYFSMVCLELQQYEWRCCPMGLCSRNDRCRFIHNGVWARLPPSVFFRLFPKYHAAFCRQFFKPKKRLLQPWAPWWQGTMA